MSDETYVDHHPQSWPPWGCLALDSFMLERWTTHLDISDADQRLALVRGYIQLSGREQQRHADKAAEGAVRPTEDQVATILSPVRDPVLRHVARSLCDSSLAEDRPLWLRTDYSDDERHAAFYEDLPNMFAGPVGAEILYDEAMILSDRRFYDSKTWGEVLELLPEMLDGCKPRTLPNEALARTQKLRVEYMACKPDSDDARVLLAALQHSQALRALLVEDAEMWSTDPPHFLMLWLDNRGDVVRSNRVSSRSRSFVLSHDWGSHGQRRGSLDGG